MMSQIHYPVDDKDLDDAALWAVIDSAAAASLSSTSKSRKPLALKYTSPVSNPNPSPPTKFPKNPRHHQHHYSADNSIRVSMEGEVLHEPMAHHHRPQKMARSCVSELSETSPLAVVRHVPRTPTTPLFSSPDSRRFSSPDVGRFAVKEYSPSFEGSPINCRQSDQKESMTHSLAGQFPSVSLFKEYQNAAMAILEKTDYTLISGSPYIKKSGWRKISFYFNLSYEIKDKTIEFDENRNVQRAEFVVRAHMQGGRFSDGWGSCERREKRFLKPNHDIPSTAETRAKNKACQDLLGIGEYRPGASHAQR